MIIIEKKNRNDETKQTALFEQLCSAVAKTTDTIKRGYWYLHNIIIIMKYVIIGTTAVVVVSVIMSSLRVPTASASSLRRLPLSVWAWQRIPSSLLQFFFFFFCLLTLRPSFTLFKYPPHRRPACVCGLRRLTIKNESFRNLLNEKINAKRRVIVVVSHALIYSVVGKRKIIIKRIIFEGGFTRI